jgi:hypothetical protein
MQRLIKKMLAIDPKSRLKFSELIESTIFDPLNEDIDLEDFFNNRK